MRLIYITNDSNVVRILDEVGVEVVMIDLEREGKSERQIGRDTRISNHLLEDINLIKSVLVNAQLWVRINPLSSGSTTEIEECISRGADGLMLPYFSTPIEVEKFIQIVQGRVQCHLLAETTGALVRLNEIVEIPGISSIHLGLNDLHIQMNLQNMFELLSGGIVEYFCSVVRKAGIQYGFGGVGRVTKQEKISASLILKEHLRLGSSQVILSRSFTEFFVDLKDHKKINFAKEISQIRQEFSVDKTYSKSSIQSRKDHAILSQLYQTTSGVYTNRMRSDEAQK